VLQRSDSDGKLFLQVHNPQTVQGVNQRSRPTTEPILVLSSERSHLILQPGMSCVSIPRMQETLLDSRLSGCLLLLLLRRLDLEHVLDARNGLRRSARERTDGFDRESLLDVFPPELRLLWMVNELLQVPKGGWLRQLKPKSERKAQCEYNGYQKAPAEKRNHDEGKRSGRQIA